VVTIGGGTVIDLRAPARMRRRDLAQRLTKLDSATPAGRLGILVAESAYGMSVDELVARTGLLGREIAAIGQSGEFLNLPEGWLASRPWAEQKLARFRDVLKEFHRKNPLLPGLAKEELRSRELGAAPAFLFDALLALTKDIVGEGEVVRLASHRLMLKQDEAEAVARIEKLFHEAGLAVPSTSDVLAKSGVEAARARSLLQVLLRDRKLMRVGEDLVFHATALQSLRQMLAARKGQRFSVAEFKDWTGVSRKYAIPLLELLDRERITRREGDARVVL
jgi:selenocysteine-specific elongation factor